MNYSVFISYRREGGFETASLIAEKLRNAGYSVFLDVESLRSGKFNEQLYAVIKQCTDFILVLPKDGLNRCANENDWVRLEVACAMQNDKNIIPVMLNGFTWPSEIPSELKGLNEYQSIVAGGHDYFDASIDKLKKYLKSKPRHWNTRRIKWLAFTATALCLCAGIVYGIFIFNSIPVCKEQADKITSKMAIVNLLIDESNAIAEAWEEYYKEYENASPSDTAYLNANIRQTLNFHRQSIRKLQKDTSGIFLSGYQRFILQLNQVEVVNIEAFHQGLIPSFFDDLYNSIDILERYLPINHVPKLSLETAQVNAEAFQHMSNSLYYSYLEFLSNMPSKALAMYNELSSSWINLPSATSIHLPKEEYLRLQKLEEEKIQNLITRIGYLTTQQSLQLEQEQKAMDQLKEKAEQQIIANKKIAMRKQQIQQRSEQLTQKQQELQDMASQLEASLRALLQKCELSSEDDQYLMWGKILRLATVVSNTAKNRREAEIRNEKDKTEARAQGVDASDWFEASYSISTQELLNEVLSRLDQYMTFFPKTKSYVPQVKAFYTSVINGERALEGMVVIATSNNRQHPVLNIGDIILQRKGMTILDVDDYKMAKQKAGDDELTFLRLMEDSQFKEFKQIVPQTDVLIGLLPLNEQL